HRHDAGEPEDREQHGGCPTNGLGNRTAGHDLPGLDVLLEDAGRLRRRFLFLAYEMFTVVRFDRRHVPPFRPQRSILRPWVHASRPPPFPGATDPPQPAIRRPTRRAAAMR